MCLLSLHLQNPSAKYVIWFRVDQKTCLKSILSVGMEPIIIDPIVEGDELSTDLAALREKLSSLKKEDVLCIIPTTSVFAPRLPDDVVGVSRIAKEFGVPVVVNNAYGLQSRETCKAINRALRVGRVDILVSSTDKNMLVPVGGALVYSARSDVVSLIRKNYPGRASMSPILDVFITLLGMGKRRLRSYLKEREDCYAYMQEQLSLIAAKHGQRLLHTPRNPISMAVTLDNPFPDDASFVYSDDDVTKFGAMLYTRGVSGIEMVECGP